MSKISLKHTGGNVVSLNSPTSAPTSADVAFKLPNQDGSANEFLKTDGSGNLAFATATDTKWVQESIATVQSGASYEFTGIPSTAREIMIRFDGISPSGGENLQFILGHSGGYSTSNYVISAGYHPNENYVLKTDSIQFHGVNTNAYTVTGKLHLWYPIHGNLWWVEGIAFPKASEGNYQHRVTGNADAGGTLSKIKMTYPSGSFDSDGNGKVQISYLSY